MAEADVATKKMEKKRSAGKQRAAARAWTGRVKVRHYCQGIGDCHLLGFPKANGGTYWMLIDCGVHGRVKGGSEKMKQVLADIAKITGGHLDVVVVTHEHMDHVSGFLAGAGTFETVDNVWMAWTEDPEDPHAGELDKFRGSALATLAKAGEGLKAGANPSPHLFSLSAGLNAMAGFYFGLDGERVRKARDAVFNLGNNSPAVRYLEPTDQPITIDELPDLRIYVLGPPRDAKLLGITERQSEMFVAAAASGGPIARALSSAFLLATGLPEDEEEGERGLPFEPNVGTDLRTLSAVESAADEDEITAFACDNYLGRPGKDDQSWRRIDHDWLGVSADLAMQLDNKTNNTSLVLAFEFVDTGRVLLFAADAQVGSWLSWHDLKWKVGDETVTGPDLLARTVYYKVSHHGSHNATLRQRGLDMMTHKDLSAFIPTNKADAAEIGWDEMPFDLIVQTLAKRCRDRVIRSDDPWLKGGVLVPDFVALGGSIAGFNHDKKDGLWVELQLA